MDKTLQTITSLIFKISLYKAHLYGIYMFMKREGYAVITYEPQILEKLKFLSTTADFSFVISAHITWTITYMSVCVMPMTSLRVWV